MIGLLEVAEHLSKRADASVGHDSADAFGRSAFNRYYYASFHTVRDLLFALDESWAKVPHKNLPGLIEGDLIKRMKRLAEQQERLGALKASRRHSLLSQAQTAANDIATILRAAYAVRIAADYEPTKPVDFFDGGFRLVQHTNTEARNWANRVEKRKGILLRVCKESGFDV
jgi:hypothetical protein